MSAFLDVLTHDSRQAVVEIHTGEPERTSDYRQGCPRGCQEANPLLEDAPWVRVWPTKMWACVFSFLFFSFFGGETHFGSKLDKNKSLCSGKKEGQFLSSSIVAVLLKTCGKNRVFFSISAEHTRSTFDSCQEKLWSKWIFCPQKRREKNKTKPNMTFRCRDLVELTAHCPKANKLLENTKNPPVCRLSQLLCTDSARQHCLWRIHQKLPVRVKLQKQPTPCLPEGSRPPAWRDSCLEKMATLMHAKSRRLTQS